MSTGGGVERRIVSVLFADLVGFTPLAERLDAATTYLVDLKRQFEGHSNHLGMVGEVLESLIHQQHEEFTPGSEREVDPRL